MLQQRRRRPRRQNSRGLSPVLQWPSEISPALWPQVRGGARLASARNGVGPGGDLCCAATGVESWALRRLQASEADGGLTGRLPGGSEAAWPIAGREKMAENMPLLSPAFGKVRRRRISPVLGPLLRAEHQRERRRQSARSPGLVVGLSSGSHS